MKILIQCKYTIDQSEVEEMLLLGFTKKEEIIELLKNNLDVSVLDNNLSNGKILDVYYDKSEEGLFE